MRTRHRIVTVLISSLALVSAALAQPCPEGTPQAIALWGRMPLCFVANEGQVDARVVYYVPGSDMTLYFTPEGITFALHDDAVAEPPRATSRVSGDPHCVETSRGRWIVKLDFVGANLVTPMGRRQTSTNFSYFTGAPDQWSTGLPSYSQIVYPDLWPGIDMICQGDLNRLKYEFLVHPSADPSRIKMAYRGAGLRVDEAGHLEVQTPIRSFRDEAPTAYQNEAGRREPIEVRFHLTDASTYGFTVGGYDPSLPLVIDPGVVVYCGYVGGTGWEDGDGIAVDGVGCAYIIGDTPSTQGTFPDTVGPDLSHNGGDDVFIAKVKADGTGLVYCGYIGGSGWEYGWGIDVDAEGKAYVSGETNSSHSTFPVIAGPDLTHNGGYDAFVAKVNAEGTALIYCGYIGGGADDYGHYLSIDDSSCVYLTGSTASTHVTFPVTVGPDLTHSGGYDAFVAKVNSEGTGLVYCGYVGGVGHDETWGIDVDQAGCAYVVGETNSSHSTFPVMVGPDLTFNGADDGFVAKVSADGAALSYCGYIGGTGYDYPWGIAVDADGNAYVSGETNSSHSTFPVIAGPDLTHNGGYDAFVAKVNPGGAGLEFCGYIGGAADDYGHACAIDPVGDICVVGGAYSTEATFPVTIGPDLTYGGSYDAFVARVDSEGTGLVYCGYLGGSGWEEAWDVALDAVGNAYVIGSTGSAQSTFPVAGGPDLTYNGGSTDAFVAKISLSCLTFDWDIPGALH